MGLIIAILGLQGKLADSNDWFIRIDSETRKDLFIKYYKQLYMDAIWTRWFAIFQGGNDIGDICEVGDIKMSFARAFRDSQ